MNRDEQWIAYVRPPYQVMQSIDNAEWERVLEKVGHVISLHDTEDEARAEGERVLRAIKALNQPIEFVARRARPTDVRSLRMDEV